MTLLPVSTHAQKAPGIAENKIIRQALYCLKKVQPCFRIIPGQGGTE